MRVRVRRFLLIARLAFALGFGSIGAPAFCEGIIAQHAVLAPGEDGWLLDADFAIELSPVLVDAVQRGVPLYFVVDVEVRRPRWYWFPDSAVEAQVPMRLTWNALTRQYRLMLGAGPLAQRYDDLKDVQQALGRLRAWKIADREMLRSGGVYDVAVRMRLDTQQLPKPFQINAITNSDWALKSDWLRFTMSPP